MKRTFEELLAVMERNGTHIQEPGRESSFWVYRNMEKGVKSVQQTAKSTGTRAGANESNTGIRAGANENDAENTGPEGLEMGGYADLDNRTDFDEDADLDLDEEDIILDEDQLVSRSYADSAVLTVCNICQSHPCIVHGRIRRTGGCRSRFDTKRDS